MDAIASILLSLVGATFFALGIAALICKRIKRGPFQQTTLAQLLLRLLIGIPLTAIGVYWTISIADQPSFGYVLKIVPFITGFIALCLLAVSFDVFSTHRRGDLASRTPLFLYPSAFLIFLSLTVYTAWASSHFFSSVDSLYPQLSEYVEICKSAGTSLSEGQPYIRGKAVPIDFNATGDQDVYLGNQFWFLFLTDPVYKGTNRIDRQTYFRIAKRIRPHSPDEVGTIISLRWGKEAARMWNVGTDFKITCQVTIIDKKKGIPVGTKSFAGDPWSFRKQGDFSSKGDTYGFMPINEVVAYINSLPQIPMDSQ